jgi:trk system potassium uptake protein TrkH
MLFACMFMGACAGSTAGGIKASRVYAAIKLGLRELRASVQPQAVVAIRLGGTAVPQALCGAQRSGRDRRQLSRRRRYGRRLP